MTELRQREPRVKRQRPPMPPLSMRVIVAERQYFQAFPWCASTGMYVDYVKISFGLGTRIKWLLSKIFEDGENIAPHALDHDPALILRDYNPRIKNVSARYKPHAHDPDFLVYRSKEEHQQKTTGRKPGATKTVTTKGSDVGLAAKFRRLEKPKRKKAKFSQGKRPWPKRKFR